MGAKWITGCSAKSALFVVLLLCRMISVTGQCSLTQDQTYKRLHFKYPTKTEFRHIRSFWLMNWLTFRGRLLWQSKLQNHRELLYRIIYIFYIFSRSFQLTKGDSVVDMTRYIETLYQGWNGTYVGVKWHVGGKMEQWNSGHRLQGEVMSQHRWILLNINIYLVFEFLHLFDWD